MIAEMFTMPIDTIKIRLQLRKSSTSAFSAVRLVKTMIESEGIVFFWKGSHYVLAKIQSLNDFIRNQCSLDQTSGLFISTYGHVRADSKCFWDIRYSLE